MLTLAAIFTFQSNLLSLCCVKMSNAELTFTIMHAGSKKYRGRLAIAVGCVL